MATRLEIPRVAAQHAQSRLLRLALRCALAAPLLLGACVADPRPQGPQPDYSGPPPNQAVDGSLALVASLPGAMA